MCSVLTVAQVNTMPRSQVFDALRGLRTEESCFTRGPDSCGRGCCSERVERERLGGSQQVLGIRIVAFSSLGFAMGGTQTLDTPGGLRCN